MSLEIAGLCIAAIAQIGVIVGTLATGSGWPAIVGGSITLAVMLAVSGR